MRDQYIDTRILEVAEKSNKAFSSIGLFIFFKLLSFLCYCLVTFCLSFVVSVSSNDTLRKF